MGLCLSPILKKEGSWSAKREWLFDYGYGVVNIHNSTHLEYKQILDHKDIKDEVFDRIMVV